MGKEGEIDGAVRDIGIHQLPEAAGAKRRKKEGRRIVVPLLLFSGLLLFRDPLLHSLCSLQSLPQYFFSQPGDQAKFQVYNILYS